MIKLFSKKIEQEVKSDIKVLGTGCAKCDALEANTVEALKRLDITEPIEHVKDVVEIAKLGVMSTPALLVDGKILFTGKVATVEEIVAAIKGIR